MVAALLSSIMSAETAIKIFISIFGRRHIARTVGLLFLGLCERSSMANKAGSGGMQISWRGKSMPDRTIDLDLWDEGSAKNLPAFTVTGQGLRIEGSIAEFDRLLLILGGWLKP